MLNKRKLGSILNQLLPYRIWMIEYFANVDDEVAIRVKAVLRDRY